MIPEIPQFTERIDHSSNVQHNILPVFVMYSCGTNSKGLPYSTLSVATQYAP